MDDEFKLCWKNFQDNIASGFQNLYDRGDLVDVTLACDGKLLHAHKIVLAICSPYFQEIFSTNPCKHPIIILKDVTFNIMCELLEFMYQGVVNVKHTELQSFMKIGQLLQIKGLATNASSSAGSTSSEKSASQIQHPDDGASACGDTLTNSSMSKSNANVDESNNADSLAVANSNKLANLVSVKSHSPASSPSPMSFGTALNQQTFKSSPDSNVGTHHSYHASGSGSGSGNSSLKRHSDLNSDVLSVYSRKQYRRSIPTMEHSGEHSDSAEGGGLDSVNAEDYFLSSIPHIASNTSAAAAAAAATLRSTFNPAAFSFDYNLYKNSGAGLGGAGAGGGSSGGGGPNSGGPEYPNDLHMPNDYSKSFANHMDIPPNSSNVVMLSSTSLLHGNCVFNRNNTVATQQGMKTYWLCKSYRISMCRARCITHQGRVISATGVHNHLPHMRGGSGGAGMGNGAVGSMSGAAGGGGGGGSFTIDAIAAQQPSIGPSNIPATTNMVATNISNTLLQSGNNLSGANSSAAGRPQQPPGVGVQVYQHHNMHGGTHSQQQQPQQQQQQQPPHSHSGGISSPPPMSGVHGHGHVHSHVHGHLPQAASNLLTQHHNMGGGSMSIGNQNSLQHHHHQHSLGVSTASSMSGTINSGALQAQNSVIQNMIHPNSASMMHHHHHHHLPHMSPMLSGHNQQEHSPHISAEQSPQQQQQQQQQQQTSHQHQHQQQPNLEITPLMQPSSPLHLQSPSNRSSNQSQHGNSLSSPIPTTTAASVGNLKSPAQTNLSEETRSVHLGEQHIMVHNAALSPSEINSSTAASVGTTDASASSQSTDGPHEPHHQAHVIDSITISPGDGHNFKIEDM